MIKYQKSALVLSVILLFFMHDLCAEVSTENSSNSAPDELVISFDLGGSEDEVATLFIAGSAFWFMVSSLLLLSTRTSKLFYLFVATEIITGSLLVASSMWLPQWIKDKKPMTILNEQGIWDQNYGSISWNDIKKVDIVQIPYSSSEFIGITIKETSLPTVKEKKSQEGKYSKFHDADSYGCHILVSPMSVPLERIITFAERFIEDN